MYNKIQVKAQAKLFFITAQRNRFPYRRLQ